MKKALRLHIGLMLAKAIYSSREAYLADLEELRKGVNAEGVELTLQEKLHIVDRMCTRLGKETAALWLPPAVLMGLEHLFAAQKEKTEETGETSKEK